MGLKFIDSTVVHEPGCRVVIGGDVPAVVSAIQIGTARSVRYLIVWWDGRVRREEWVDPAELSAADAISTRVTFVGRA